MRVITLSWLLLLRTVVLQGQCPPNTVPSQNNLILNPDFSQGNMNFTSQYTYCNAFNCLWPEATYAVGNDASFFHTNFIGLDHTNPPTGFFMIVNGAGTPNLNVWCQTVAVNQNTTYEFSVWVQSVVVSNPAILQFRINGQLIGPTFNASNTLNNWQQHYVTWNSGTNTSADLCIVNQNTAQSGNDFGLDDLRFTECMPCQITQVVATPDTLICAGQSVQLHAQADTPSTYVWSPAGILNNATSQSPVASPAQTTTVIVTATDSIGCTRQDTLTLTVDVGPVFTLQTSDTLCLGDTVQMPLSTSATGVSWQWQPTTGLSNPSISNPLVYSSSTTTYTLTAIGPTGCESTGTIQVFVADHPTANAGPDRVLCGTTGFVQLNGSYTDTALVTGFQWTPFTGLTNPNILSPVANPAQTQIYTLTVTNRWGCTDTDTMRVSRVFLTLDAGPDLTICTGDTAQLQAQVLQGVTYQWSPAATLSNPIIPDPFAWPASSQYYTLMVTDTNGCFAFDIVQVTVTNSPTLVITPDTTMCAGDSVQLSATGTNTFQWQPATGLSCTNCPNPVAKPTQTTTYTVIGSSGTGCSDTGTITLTVNPMPVVQVSADTSICAGDTISLWATGGDIYTWAPGTSLSCYTCPSPQAYPIGTTTYTVTGETIYGCIAEASVTISVQQGPPLQVSNDTTICSGTQANLQVSGGNSYQWAPSGTLSCSTCPNPIASPTSSTTFTVTGFNPIGCNTVDTVRVTISGTSQITITGDTTVCQGDSVQWIASGATAYQWAPALGLSCSNCPDPIILPGTTTTVYTLTVTDTLGCFIPPIPRTLTVLPPPTAAIAYADTACEGEVAQLTASGGGLYVWFPSTGLSCVTCPNPVFVMQQSVVYFLEVTDVNGCRDTAMASIISRPAPSLTTSGNVSICAGDSALVSVVSNASILWSGGSWISCDTCAATTVWPSITSTLYVVASDNIGCTSMDSIEIIVHTLPIVQAGPDTLLCGGASAQLWATGGQSYAWSPATGLSCISCPDPVAQPLQSTIYTVVATDSGGCSANAEVEISIAGPLAITVSADTTICYRDTATLSASGGTQYDWFPAQDVFPQGAATVKTRPTQTTTFTLVVLDTLGCSVDTTITVTVHVPLPLNAGPDTVVCHGATVQLFASNAFSYSWVPSQFIDTLNSIGPVSIPWAPVVYTVTGTDSIGCEVRETVNIQLYPYPVVDAGPDQTIIQGQTAQLNGLSESGYYWTPPHLLLDNTLPNPTTFPLYDSVLFYLYVVDSNGCEAYDWVWVFTIPDVKLFVPNAFSPNGDGMNDIFIPVYDDKLILGSLNIFDRWGQLVFRTTDMGTGWDGRFNGEPMPIGTYVYFLEGTIIDGRPLSRRGNITLIR